MMKELKKAQKILNKEVQLYFKKELQYRNLIIVRTISDIVKIVAISFVWLMASKSTNNISQGYIVTYYILATFMGRLMSDYTVYQGPQDIISGNFSKFIVKPFNYLIEYLGVNIGFNSIRFILSLPAFIFGIFLVGNYWVLEFNPYNIFVSLIAIILGFTINFLLGNIFTLGAFFTKQMDGIRTFYFNIASFFSGEYIPLIFMSFNMRFASEILPFRYTLSFPMELLIGKIEDVDVERGFVISIIWIVVLFVSYKLLYKKSLKKYEAEGI